MCWVMPPASPDTTLAWRSASSSEVLPWSTWPITVTTGERGSVSVESSTMSNRPSSTSLAATRLTVWPISSATSCAVSASITSVIFTIWPCFISSRITSTARSAMRLASSWMVMASGIVTSRMSFSFGSFEAWPLRRWVRRRNDAIERSRTSSALSAVTSVRRPRCLAGAGFAVVFGGAAGRATPPGPRRIWRGPSSSSLISAATPGARAAGNAARTARGGLGLGFAETLFGFGLGLALGFLVLAMAVFLGLAAGFRGFALGLLDAFLAVAAGGLGLGNAALFDVATFRIGQRARARGPFVLRQCAQHHAGTARAAPAWQPGASARIWRAPPWRRPARARARHRRASPPTRRLPRFSTTTCLVRPWLKLWRTVPVSTRGFSVKVLVGTLSVLSPGDLVSTIQQSQSCSSCACPHSFISKVVVVILVFSWPHGRQSCRRQPSGIGPESGCVTGMSCPPRPRAGQHVSHLTAQVPNPIVRMSARR